MKDAEVEFVHFILSEKKLFQFYFLSVILNLFIGLVLFFSDTQKSSESELCVQEETEEPLKKNNFRENLISLFARDSVTDNFYVYLISGILSCFTGLVKFLQAVNGIALLGDLLPCVAGIAGGASILLLALEKKSSVKIDINESLSFVLVQSRKYVGVACIIVSLLHFLLPGALFL